MTSDYILFSTLWVLWCVIHSWLITPKVTAYFRQVMQTSYRFYRIAYNLFSIVTFLLLILFKPFHNEAILFSWQGSWQIIRYAFLATSLLIFFYGAKNYDMFQFLGIRQLTSNSHTPAISRTGELSFSGLLKFSRHPWYLAGIIFIWTLYSDFPLSRFISCAVLTIYFMVGTVLEERKLTAEYGDQYKKYQQQVSMLVPMKYFFSLFKKENKKG